MHVDNSGWLDVQLRITHADAEAGVTTIADTSALGPSQVSIIFDGLGPDHSLKKLEAGAGVSIADNGDRLAFSVAGSASTKEVCLSTGAPITSAPATFALGLAFVFPGTTRTGAPTGFTALIGMAGGAGTVEVDVRDITNGNALIAGPATGSNASPAQLPLAYSGAASAGPALWQARFRRVAPPAPASFAGITIFF